MRLGTENYRLAAQRIPGTDAGTLGPVLLKQSVDELRHWRSSPRREAGEVPGRALNVKHNGRR